MNATRRSDDTIDSLAARAGFEVEWQDAHHVTQHVPESTLAVLLERMGLPCGNATQIRQSAAALEAELSGRKLPPLMTAECERGIALPAAAIKSGSHYRIELESGSQIDGRFTAPKGEAALLVADRRTRLSHARDQRPPHHAGGGAVALLHGRRRVAEP